MGDKRLDFEAPLLSVRRFSESQTAVPTDSNTLDSNPNGSIRRPRTERRASLPFYKPDLKSGPVRHPGVVPFVWENKPGQPKNGLISNSKEFGGRQIAAPKPPPGRLIKPGSSVRTRKATTFTVDNGTGKDPDTFEDVFEQLSIEKDKEKLENVRDNVVEKKDVKVIEKEEDVEKKDEEKQRENEKGTEQQKLPIFVVDNGHCDDDGNEGEDAFSDALDTMSRTESLFMNCSVSGISGTPNSSKGTGSFSTDPQVREFMMGRFLPAAQAMASDSPQYTFRKTVATVKETTRITDRIGGGDLGREPPRPPQQRSNLILQYDKEQEVVDSCENDEEDEDEYENVGQFPSKACGFLPNFCLKGNFGRLNPIPGMNFQGRKPTPPRSRKGTKIKSSIQAFIGHPENSHSWEDVYKHKMVHGAKQNLEDGSKLRSVSNELTFSSESPTAEVSSPNCCSADRGTPPLRNEAQLPSFYVGKGFLGIPSSKQESISCNTDGFDLCEKDGENFWETTSRHSSHLDSDSLSPALEKTVHVDSVNMPEALVSKSSSFRAIADSRGLRRLSEDSAVGTRSQRMEGFIVEVDSSLPKVLEAVVPGLSRLERLNHEQICCDSDVKLNSCENHLFPSDITRKINADSLQPLIPPPLPKTPSESWLSRALPSVASKNLTSQSLLVIGCQPKKQTSQAPMLNQKQGKNAKFPKSQVRRIRFAEVLATPASPKSEI